MNNLERQLEEAAGVICEICGKAWQKNLMPGWSGNASLRLEAGILITAAGAAKGFLSPGDCVLVSPAGELLAGCCIPSSESGAHLALYKKFPQCKAILHTHPGGLQALEAGLRATEKVRVILETLPLHEAAIWAGHFEQVPSFLPGSAEIAKAVGRVAFHQPLPLAVWLSGHGLMSMGATLLDCLCLTEELEHLAGVALAIR